MIIFASFFIPLFVGADSGETYTIKSRFNLIFPDGFFDSFTTAQRNNRIANINIKCFGYSYFDENKTQPSEIFSYDGKCNIDDCQLELDMWSYRQSYDYCDAHLTYNGKELEAKRFVEETPWTSGFCQSVNPLNGINSIKEKDGKYYMETAAYRECEKGVFKVFYPKSDGNVLTGDFLCDDPKNMDIVDEATECREKNCGYGYTKIDNVLYEWNSGWYNCIAEEDAMHKECDKLLQETKPKYQYNSEGKIFTDECHFFLELATPGNSTKRMKFLNDQDIYTEMVFYVQVAGKSIRLPNETKIKCRSFSGGSEILGGDREARQVGESYGFPMNGDFMIPPPFKKLDQYSCDLDMAVEDVGSIKIEKFYQTGKKFDWQRNGVDCFEIFGRKNADGSIANTFDIETVKYQDCQEQGGSFKDCKKYMVEYNAADIWRVHDVLAAGKRAQACKLIVELPKNSTGSAQQGQKNVTDKKQINSQTAAETKPNVTPMPKPSIWQNIICFFKKLFGGNCQ